MIAAGTITSVNVGPRKRVEYLGKTFYTGFCKQPVTGPVFAGGIALAGDTQVCMHLHEGDNAKAIYAYTLEDYDWFAAEYGITPERALFGENLTLRGVDLRGCVVGDTWRAGAALLEASEPRLPCYKLGWRMGDARWVKIFARALRPGSYFRVVEPGPIAPGDAFELVDRPNHGLTIAEVMRIRLYAPNERERFIGIAALPFNYHAWANGERDVLNDP
jgi:MOSC domain-containing protein YiiM